MDWLYGLLDDVAATRGPAPCGHRRRKRYGEDRLGPGPSTASSSPSRSGVVRSPGGFWPDAFQRQRQQIEGQPRFPEGVIGPSAPPKFMWLGLGWHSPGQTETRTIEAARCPKSREMLYRHVKVVEGMPGIWRGFRERLKRKGAEFRARGIEETAILAAEGVTNVAFGPLAPFARFLVAAAREAHQGKEVEHEYLKKKAERSAGDELCEELGWLMGGKRPLPTIVWLDDAQWIDASSIEFLENLFRRAKNRNSSFGVQNDVASRRLRHH